MRRPLLPIAIAAAAALLAGGCGASSGGGSSSGQISAVGAENEYANVISQVGGRYVHVTAIMSDPNTDPHTFESSPKVANAVSSAKLVVENGVGYDDFVDKIVSANHSSDRQVLNVAHLTDVPDDAPNPHLWYKPTTMPTVADAVARSLAKLQPGHAAVFQANAQRFIASLGPWNSAIAQFKSTHPGAPVATTEPVADYLLEAAGVDNMTPFSLQAAIMNGNDPSPQDIATERGLLSGRKVKAFVYNQQVTDTLTQSLLKLAAANHIPVVGVYETMPTPGYTYQTWMQAEVKALNNAVTNGVSAAKL